MKTQRWKRMRDIYRPAGEPIDTSRYAVEPIEFSDAKEFVLKHHYSRSYPSCRYQVGLKHIGKDRCERLVGVAMFSHPQNERTIPKYVSSVEGKQGIELGRFVLLDFVPANGESWFLGQAFDLLRENKPEVKVVLSFSDPIPRQTATGDSVMPGHVGIIYQAHNGRYCGRAGSKTLLLDPNGQTLGPRTLSKIRNQEVGGKSAYERLVSMGARRKRACESWSDYVKSVTSEPPFKRIRHPGNHAYVWTVAPDRRERKELQKNMLPAMPYPK